MADEPIFRFLDLPGELRNCVYKIAASETDEKLTRLSQPPLTAGLVMSPNHRPRDWNKFKRQFLALTQVNKLTRKEFLQLYHQQLHPSVRIQDLQPYIRDFVIANNERTETITNTITIRTSDGEGQPEVCNVLELHNLLAKLPHLRITMEAPENDAALLWLLRCRPDTPFWKYVDNCVSHIEFFVNRNGRSGYIWFFIVPEFAEDWMRNVNCVGWVDEQIETIREWCDGVSDWAEKLGIDEDLVADLVVVVEEGDVWHV